MTITSSREVAEPACRHCTRTAPNTSQRPGRENRGFEIERHGLRGYLDRTARHAEEYDRAAPHLPPEFPLARPLHCDFRCIAQSHKLAGIQLGMRAPSTS